MKYTVKPSIVEGCACEDCRAGRHIYSLFRWTEGAWRWVGTSLQSYSNLDEARKHEWFINFGPDAIWEDGTPIVEPETMPQAQRDDASTSEGSKVPLNLEAAKKSVGLLEK